MHLTDMLKYGILVEEEASKGILCIKNAKLDQAEKEEV